MTSLVSLVLLSLASYGGTMVDNVVAFSAQLALTPEEKRPATSAAQSAGVAVLVLISLGLGSALRLVPLSFFGLCALAPWALAVHTFRHRHDVHSPTRRGVTGTFVSTLALGGDNLAVWTPLLRAGGILHGLVVLAVFAVSQIAFVTGARSLVRHPHITRLSDRAGQWALPAVYLALGVVILLETGVL